MAQSIEDIILEHDRRGVSALRPYIPADFCFQAARYVMECPGPVAIATGFYILMAGRPETDGPPGAIAIGNALRSLGRRVSYVTDIYAAPVLRDLGGDAAEVIDFPIAGVEASRRLASSTLARLSPGLLVSIERCGRTGKDTYLNMRAADITPYTARLDYLFESGVPSVGIGDGGNEIGMGNLAEVIPTKEGLPQQPAVTRVDRLVIASVSNWGGYGLVAALSLLAGRNLLPSAEHETALIHRMIDLGVVDGTTGSAVATVDNFSTSENGDQLERLHQLVEEGVGAGH